jgi:hypothetical protein
MRLFRMFLVTSLLFTAFPRPAAAGVGAKSVQGLFAPEECEAIPELLGRWAAPGARTDGSRAGCASELEAAFVEMEKRLAFESA